MHLTIANSKIKKRNLGLINNVTYQKETLLERPIRQPLRHIQTVNRASLFSGVDSYLCKWTFTHIIKGVLHLWALFLKVLCIFSKNKATSDKVSYGSGQKCSK